MKTKFKLNNQGDTLIEVIIATVIIGMVLFSAFTLSNEAYKLGQSAKERSQATQLIQEQAEGLRALRDSATSWSNFRGQIQAAGSTFHLEKSGNQWSPVGGQWNPGEANDTLPDYYTLRIEGSFTQPSQERFTATITISWPRLGGGVVETSELYYRLTDRNITIPAS